MDENKMIQIRAERERLVVKANELIQQSRFDLSLKQQKIVLYLISKINANDEDFKLYQFPIRQFCRVCGIEYNGKEAKELKEQIQAIRDKSIWVKLPNGKSTTVSWIEKPYIDEEKGTIEIRLDKDMKPFLLQLRQKFTKYQLLYTIRYRSKYSIRAYEWLKSILYDIDSRFEKNFDIDYIKQVLGAEKYTSYTDFRKRVFIPSIDEINYYSDLEVDFTEIRNGRKVVAIRIGVESKTEKAIAMIQEEIDKELGPAQLQFQEQEE